MDLYKLYTLGKRGLIISKLVYLPVFLLSIQNSTDKFA